MSRECSTHGREEECIQGFGGKDRRGKPIGSLRCNIKINLREIGCDGIKWIYLVQGSEQWRAAVNLRVP
jgi:hypothetical protein